MDENRKTPEELLAEMQALRADCERYYNEAKRYRNEARNCMKAARVTHGAMVTEKNKIHWITEGVPAFPVPYRTDEVNDHTYMLSYEASARSDFEAYADALTKAGYTLHTASQMGKGIHAFYQNGKVLVSLSWGEHDKVLRAVVEPLAETALVPLDTICDGKEKDLPLLFTQMGDHLYDIVDCGMSYIFRLTDGSFLLIDGGWETPAIGDALYAKLEELSEGRPIVISAWFITHAHHDHMGALYAMSAKYGDKVTLKRIIQNFPGAGRMVEMGDEFAKRHMARFPDICAAYGDVQVIRARTGQQYHFPGLDLDMLFTYEDHKMPFGLHDFNETSLVFRITAAGETFMFLGDASVAASNILVAKYGREMESDIVQVAHHGYGGGTKEVYDAVKAPIVIWPICLFDPRNNAPRYNNPTFSPITREMIKAYATKTYAQCDKTYTHVLPLKNDREWSK